MVCAIMPFLAKWRFLVVRGLIRLLELACRWCGSLIGKPRANLKQPVQGSV
jgi:hypothetical protein